MSSAWARGWALPRSPCSLGRANACKKKEQMRKVCLGVYRGEWSRVLPEVFLKVVQACCPDPRQGEIADVYKHLQKSCTNASNYSQSQQKGKGSAKGEFWPPAAKIMGMGLGFPGMHTPNLWGDCSRCRVLGMDVVAGPHGQAADGAFCPIAAQRSLSLLTLGMNFAVCYCSYLLFFKMSCCYQG